MSTLILSECMPTVFQEITMTKSMFVAHIVPRLFVYGSPAGTVKVQLQDANGRVIRESNTVTITDVKTLAYGNKYVRFDIAANLINEQIYRVAIVCGGGYSFSESAYVAVNLDWDKPKRPATYINNSGANAALDFDLYERVET